MKRALWATTAVLAVLWCTASADEQIYESKEKGGVPEFSGQPTPGSEPVTLPAPNVIDTTQPQVQPPAAQQDQSAGYSQLAIVSPSQQGIIHTNTGAFDVNRRRADAEER